MRSSARKLHSATPTLAMDHSTHDQVLLFSARHKQASTEEKTPSRLSRTIQKELNKILKAKPELALNAATPPAEWLAQFKTEADQKLALKLLKQFEWIDISTLRKDCAKLHQWLINQPGFDIDKTKFSHFAYGKSGGVIQYFYRQANQLSNQSGMAFDRAVQPPEIVPNKPIDTLVIVEDFLGSGVEADYFFKRLKESLIAEGKTYRKIYFLPIISFGEGEKLLQEKYSDSPFNLEVKAGRHPKKILSPEHTGFSESEKSAILEILTRYSEQIYPKEKFGKVATPTGYRDGQALTAFFYNTPSNTLPIFWSAFNGWKPLFPRFDSFNKDTGEWRFPKILES